MVWKHNYSFKLIFLECMLILYLWSSFYKEIFPNWDSLQSNSYSNFKEDILLHFALLYFILVTLVFRLRAWEDHRQSLHQWAMDSMSAFKKKDNKCLIHIKQMLVFLNISKKNFLKLRKITLFSTRLFYRFNCIIYVQFHKASWWSYVVWLRSISARVYNKSDMINSISFLLMLAIINLNKQI